MHIQDNDSAVTGFTLIEMSIVLVIIALIIGGILTGQDLINAATIRAQISQIEKFNTAVHTFRYKYGGLPGDLQETSASQFGFVSNICDGTTGHRDGNGAIDGYWAGGPTYVVEYGEALLFWSDLSAAGLISDAIPHTTPGIFNGGCGTPNTGLSLTSGTYYIGNFLPAAKIGNGNFIYTYDGNNGATYAPGANNWFGISAVTSVPTNGNMLSAPAMSVIQAYNIDQKVDDGVPTQGSARAIYLNTNYNSPANDQVSDSTTSCYNKTTSTYSINVSQGTNVNCALSFRLQ